MTVQELLEELQKVEDKSLPVFSYDGEGESKIESLSITTVEDIIPSKVSSRPTFAKVAAVLLSY